MKIFLFALLFSFNAFAQDMDTLKEQDTIYIVLPIKEQFKAFKYRRSCNKILCEYILSENSENKVVLITAKKNTEPLMMKRGDINKKALVDFGLLEKYGLSHIFNITLKINTQKKVVYVIKEKELKNKKVKMTKATAVSVGYVEM